MIGWMEAAQSRANETNELMMGTGTQATKALH
jgi:hypothetical protein